MAKLFMKFLITCHLNGTEDDLVGDTENGGPSGTADWNDSEDD